MVASLFSDFFIEITKNSSTIMETHQILTVHYFIQKNLTKFESLVVVIPDLTLMRYVDFDALLIINYFANNVFQLRENGVNNCFETLISSVFTTVASRVKSEQKEKEKNLETKDNMI